MTKLTLTTHPLMLGFDQLERMVEQLGKSDLGGYPPFNIEQLDANAFRITLAVAGFGEDDLTVTHEDRQLVIRGRIAEDQQERVWLHRGIAGRQFQRAFVLAEGVEVAGAALENGLLHVDLKRNVQDAIIRTIPINSKKGGTQ